LESLKEGKVLISEADIKKINTRYQKGIKAWKDRRRKVFLFFFMILFLIF